MAIFSYAATDNLGDSLMDDSIQNNNQKMDFFATDSQFSKRYDFSIRSYYERNNNNNNNNNFFPNPS